MECNTKFKVFLIIILAIAVAFTSHFLLVNSIVNDYFNKNHKDVFFFDFYEQPKINESNPIFFVGSSQMESGINPPLIENILHDFNFSCNVYNLGIEGETPIRRIPEISYIISNNPKIVVIGLTYYELNYYNTPGSGDVRITQIFSSRQVMLNDEEKQLFYPEEIKFYDNPLEQYLLKKKYFLKSVDNFIFRKDPNNWKNNVKTLYKGLTRDLSPKDKIEEFNKAKDYFDGWKNVGNESNRQKKALNYTIYKLKENNITVVLINMPLHSLLSNSIPNETRYNYLNYISSTGVLFYDLETTYPDNEFGDIDHLNKYGRTNLSKDIALKIYDIENGNNDDRKYSWTLVSNNENDIINIQDSIRNDRGSPYDTQEGLTLYKVDSSANLVPLEVSLGEGWYPLEKDSNSKWRWMGENTGLGTINLINNGEEKLLNVTLEYGSSLPDNSLSVFLDTKEYGQCMGSSDCKISNILLPQGKHTLFLKPKIMTNNMDHRDQRNLIYLFRNITIYVN
jgi:hypothetical protein